MPRKITFYQRGDYYEARNDDVEIVANALGLVRTSRLIDGVRTPVTFIPSYRFIDWSEQLRVVGFTIDVKTQAAQNF